ncbi:MAG TPA: carboxylating nicotinate-nucleotide diphosphorylase [Chthoniobacterales bacterium]|nr:carboxylating nicotinate-nucleotide diphosphorylase [Chthoniobacterales bacterium]
MPATQWALEHSPAGVAKMAEADPIDLALREDIGPGDITTALLVPADSRAQARILSREKAIIAGTMPAAEVFRRVDPALKVSVELTDGTAVLGGETILRIQGAARSILTAERVALNFLQRLSGIATLTREYVEAIGKNPAKIMDTRKTTPGLRALEKAAVVAGGGTNHRFGLFDAILVKDNHLVAERDLVRLATVIRQARAQNPEMKIEVEAENLEQVRALVQMAGVDVILLDNMETAEMREAIALGRKQGVKFEASGGINLRTVRRIAATGVDYISVGALTHSPRAIDISLELTHVGS